MALYVCLALTIIWFLFMTFLSHQDGEHTGKAGRELAEDLAEHLSFLGADVNALNGNKMLFVSTADPICPQTQKNV